MASRRKRDYYEVLGVDRKAGDTEIKRAFREIARKYHPDLNPGKVAEDRFKEANEAYAVLSDERARARYDRYGHAGVGNAYEGQTTPSVDNVLDMLDELLRRRKRKKRGRDLRYTLEVTFEEAAFGCEKKIKVADPEHPDRPARAFTVQVPAGTVDGAVRTLRGEGGKGTAGGKPGDLCVMIRVGEHAMFRREGHDVVCEVPVSFTQAALGTVVDVPTLDGKVRMRIPEGTQSGRVFRMRDRGVPRGASKSGPRGDQMVRVIVETPTGLSQRQRDLLEEFARSAGEPLAHPQRKGFLDKLRDLFAE